MSTTRPMLASFIARNSDRFGVTGRGAFGRVFGITGKDWVVKVSSNSDHYGDFVDAILYGPLKGNKHVPRIMYSRENPAAYERVTVMERLEPWAEVWYSSSPEELAVAALQATPEKAHYDSGTLCWPSEDTEELYQQTSDDWKTLVLWLREQCSRDLHHGNCMFRADGTAVITDPLC